MLSLLVVELLGVIAFGAIRVRELIGTAFYPMHSILFFLAFPSLASVMSLQRRIHFLSRWYSVGIACAVLSLLIILFQFVVSESLYGVDGTSGPYGLPHDNITWVIISALVLGAIVYSQPNRLLQLLNQKIPLIVGIFSVLINWLTLEKGFDLPIWFILNMLPFSIAMLTSFNWHEPNMFIFHIMVFAQWFYLTAIILERRKTRRAELNLTFQQKTKD